MEGNTGRVRSVQAIMSECGVETLNDLHHCAKGCKL